VNLTVSTGQMAPPRSPGPDYITVTNAKGDFGGDGEVDIGDVARVACMVVGKTAIDLAADFNGNDAVDIAMQRRSPTTSSGRSRRCEGREGADLPENTHEAAFGHRIS
jgi:hypothetical protein